MCASSPKSVKGNGSPAGPAPDGKKGLPKKLASTGKRPRLKRLQQGEDAPVDRDWADQDPVFSDVDTVELRSADSVETLPELERAIGIADWLDPETGEPAEGQSPPHLEQE